MPLTRVGFTWPDTAAWLGGFGAGPDTAAWWVRRWSGRLGNGVAFVVPGGCIYPALGPQPIKEDHQLIGPLEPLEPTIEWYAIAKIAGVKMCQASPRIRLQHDLSDADQPVRFWRQLRSAGFPMCCRP